MKRMILVIMIAVFAIAPMSFADDKLDENTKQVKYYLDQANYTEAQLAEHGKRERIFYKTLRQYYDNSPEYKESYPDYKDYVKFINENVQVPDGKTKYNPFGVSPFTDGRRDLRNIEDENSLEIQRFIDLGNKMVTTAYMEGETVGIRHFRNLKDVYYTIPNLYNVFPTYEDYVRYINSSMIEEAALSEEAVH